jgi:transposase
MLKIREGAKILVSIEPIDARKSIDGLCGLIPEKFYDNPQSGNIFIFFNKSRDKAKILYWDKNGFILHYKRMEKCRFHLPRFNNLSQLEITEDELEGLLAGFDFSIMRQFKEINYSKYL